MSIRDLMPFGRRRDDKVAVCRGPGHDRGLAALHDDVDRLFERVFPEVFGGTSARGQLLTFDEGLSPGLDVRETDAEVRVIAEMPGVEEKDLAVTLTNQVLTIRGERCSDAGGSATAGARATAHRRYERMVTIDADIDPEKVSAVYRNGVLTVALPKSEGAGSRGRRVPVKAI